MSSDFKKKTITNILWSTLDKVGQQVIYLSVYVLLARLLTPADYGLMGVLAIFIALSNVFIDSGMNNALIHKKHTTQQDYCSVFYFNLGAGILIYLILFFCAPLIADFFKQPELVGLSRCVFLAIIVNALGIVQSSQLNKKLNFRASAQINIFSLLISSTGALWMAFHGYGVWALAAQTLGLSVGRVFLIICFNRWYPKHGFKFAPIRELLPFSSKILGAGILNSIFANIYPVIIGRLFPIAEVGFYTQANKLQDIPSGLVTNVFHSIAFPTLSAVNEDEERMVRIFRRSVQTIAMVIFPVMMGLSVIGKHLIPVLMSDKWADSIPLFEILCYAGIAAPFTPLFNSFILAKSRSGDFLLFEVLRKLVLLGLIVGFVYWGVTGLAVSWVIYSYLSVLIGLFFLNRLIGYGVRTFLRDIFPFCAGALAMVAAIWPLKWLIGAPVVCLTLQVVAGAGVYIVAMRLFAPEVYAEAEKMAWQKIKRWLRW